MSPHAPVRRAARVGSTIAFGALLLLGGAVAAARQEAPPPHPAHIHTGSCADLGDVVAPLSDLAMPTGGTREGAVSALPVSGSVTTVDLSVADILGSPHALNIHESAENIGNYIACGDIGGGVQNDAVLFGIASLNDSGAFGGARLRGVGDQTEVTVYLVESQAAGAAAGAGTPMAGGVAASSPAAAESVTVTMKDLAYDPPTVEVPVGGTVTWTNADTVPHTATAQDRGLLQSGTIDPGASYSSTFDTPGTFDYFCEFHANMKGTVVVQ